MTRYNLTLSGKSRRDYCHAMAMTFRDALLATLEETSTTMAKVAREAGVSYEQLKALKQGRSGSTNVDDAIKIAHYFGMSIDEFIGDETQRKRREILDLYSQLSEQERVLLTAAARGFLVQGRQAG